MLKSNSDCIPKMTLDLKKPLAVFFLLIGSLLAGYGMLAPQASAVVHVGFNVNLVWGLSMDGFGLLLLLFRGKK